MSQGINGVQTVYSYEATVEYGVLHKVTKTVQANGSIVPGQCTRNVEYIAENGTTSRSEQYVHTGEDWYRLMPGTRTVLHPYLDYGHQDSIIGMNMEELESSFTWEYDQTRGFLNYLNYPNGMVRSNTYPPRLNLITAIGYKKGTDGEPAACHEYQCDALMCPVQRRVFWDRATPAAVRDFTYNNHSELIEDRIRRGESFSYQYDNIGNRKTASDDYMLEGECLTAEGASLLHARYHEECHFHF